jgi:hypothetical protein
MGKAKAAAVVTSNRTTVVGGAGGVITEAAAHNVGIVGDAAMEVVVGVGDEVGDLTTDHWTTSVRNLPTIPHLQTTMLPWHTKISRHCRSSIRHLNNWSNSSSNNINNTSNNFRGRMVMEGASREVEPESCLTSKPSRLLYHERPCLLSICTYLDMLYIAMH